MTIGRSRLVCAVLSLVALGSGAACGANNESKPPATAAQPQPAPQTPSAAAAPSVSPQPGAQPPSSPPSPPSASGAEDEAELVVNRDVVSECPTLRLVRRHASEFDADMVWLAVLESIADCMAEGGPMGQRSIAVSGDERHRQVVREVLGSHGIDATRVVATPESAEGAAECQGDADCAGKRVEITVVPANP